MTTTAKLLGILAGVGGLAYGAKKGSKWEVCSGIQTGIISNIDNGGLIWKTWDIRVQRSRISNGDGATEILMSLHENSKVREDAEKFCAAGTFVQIHYKQTLFPNLTKGSSNIQVTKIEEVSAEEKSISL